MQGCAGFINSLTCTGIHGFDPGPTIKGGISRGAKTQCEVHTSNKIIFGYPPKQTYVSWLTWNSLSQKQNQQQLKCNDICFLFAGNKI